MSATIRDEVYICKQLAQLALAPKFFSAQLSVNFNSPGPPSRPCDGTWVDYSRIAPFLRENVRWRLSFEIYRQPNG